MARVKKLVQQPTAATPGCLKDDGMKSVSGGGSLGDEAPKPIEPVKLVPGAMFGFCPKCSAPAEMREITSGGPPWGKDRCQNKHVYPSMAAMARPLVDVVGSYKPKVIPKRGRNKK